MDSWFKVAPPRLVLLSVPSLIISKQFHTGDAPAGAISNDPDDEMMGLPRPEEVMVPACHVVRPLNFVSTDPQVRFVRISTEPSKAVSALIVSTLVTVTDPLTRSLPVPVNWPPAIVPSPNFSTPRMRLDRV